MVEKFLSCTSIAPPPYEGAGITLVSGPHAERREDLASFPVRDKPCDRERPRRGVHLQQGEIGEQSPFLSQGVDPSPNVLQRIQIKYVEDGEGIRKYFAAYLLFDNFPAAFVVDDFAEFFSERSCERRYGNSRARDLAVVHILALCQKAIAHANAKLGTLGSCNLLLSDVHLGDTSRSLFIYKRWISSIYTIQGKSCR